jgi:hypothetical protein
MGDISSLLGDTEATDYESVTPKSPEIIASASKAVDNFNLYGGINIFREV